MFKNIKYNFGITFLIITLLLLTSCSTKNISETSSDTATNSSSSEFGKSKNAESEYMGNTESRKFGASTSNNKNTPDNTPSFSNENSNNPSESDNSHNNPISSSGKTHSQNSLGNNNTDSAQDYNTDDNTDVLDTTQNNSDAEHSTCSLIIDCSSAVKSEKLSAKLLNVLPSDGIIYTNQNLEFEDGESAFDLLNRITRQNGIPMEFSSSLTSGSKYIQGINSLYEFDCGETSGWTYKVNGISPNYGCDSYTVNPDDTIIFCYVTSYEDF